MKSIFRILRALVMAVRGHRGQTDKALRPYWHHLLTVAWVAYGMTHEPEAVVVGLLHDYMEDVAPVTGFERLGKRFGYYMAGRVNCLTRKKYESYDIYITRIVTYGDPIVRAVKLADLLHNTEPKRIPNNLPSEKTASLKRSLRYERAIERLLARRMEESRV